MVAAYSGHSIAKWGQTRPDLLQIWMKPTKNVWNQHLASLASYETRSSKWGRFPTELQGGFAGFANQPPALQSRGPCPTSKDRTKNTESFALSFQFFYVFSWMLSCTQFSSEILSQCSVCHFSLVLSVSLKTLQSFSVSCSLWMFTCTFYLHINFLIFNLVGAQDATKKVAKEHWPQCRSQRYHQIT